MSNLRTRGAEIAGLPRSEALEVSGLSWKVVPLPLDVIGATRNIRVADRRALMRSDMREGDPQPLAIVSNRYEIFQNDVQLGMMYEAAEAAGVSLDRAGSYDGGRRIWAVSQSTARGSGEVSVGDIVSCKLRMISGHEAGISLRVESIIERLVCLNGMTSKRVSRRISISHRRKLTQSDLDNVKELFTESIGRFQYFLETARELRNKQADRMDNRLIIADMLGPQILDSALRATIGPGAVDRIVAEHSSSRPQVLAKYRRTLGERQLVWPEEVSSRHRNIIDAVIEETERLQVGRELSQGTFWGTVNGITSYYNHRAGRNSDSGLESAFNGPGAKNMDAAFETVAEYAANR